MVQVDYFTMNQTDRVRYLNQKVRAGELTWSNNIRDLLCSVGIEDFVLLIGGTKCPSPSILEEGEVWSYRGGNNWSADLKHDPAWSVVNFQQVTRRIIKIGGRRAQTAVGGYKTCRHQRELFGIRTECQCGKQLKSKCENIEEIRIELIKEFLL